MSDPFVTLYFDEDTAIMFKRICEMLMAVDTPDDPPPAGLVQACHQVIAVIDEALGETAKH
jgi:hypothetical protein